MRIAFFGSSLVSSYWNGAATYYRGLLRALAQRGHRISFYEPDAYERQQHRDIGDPDWAEVIVYPAKRHAALRAVEAARGADLVVKASGVGVFDRLLEEAVLELQGPATRVVYWDVDAPATLERVRGDRRDPFRALIPRYDLVFTYGGGPPVIRSYEALGARACVPIYNALDPDSHRPEPPLARFAGDLGFLANRLPDRELRVREFFLRAAHRLPNHRFILGGSGWDDAELPRNVRRLGHVSTTDHNAFNASSRAILNVTRDSMAATGYSPPTRVFEAAGAGACLITDRWKGLSMFLEPGEEVLAAEGGDEVAEHLAGLDGATAQRLGERARARILAEHTYAHRARDVEAALGEERRSPSAVARGAATPEPVIGGGNRPLTLGVVGLSITSSWGNGHATTYRALLRELARRGHRVHFYECDVPWYAANRDLSAPPYCHTHLYRDLDELSARFGEQIAAADAILVGSCIEDGIEVGRWVQRAARGIVGFYDIDTPVTLAALKDGSCRYLAQDLIPSYDLYLSFTGGPMLEEIERRFGARRAAPLYCSVDPDIYYPNDEVTPRWDLGYLGTYAPDRQLGVQRLLLEPARRRPQWSFVLAGPQYPDSIAWPDNVARRDHVPPVEHRAFYTQQRFTLNLTRQHMIDAGYSPSVRLFEAAACATPIISDAWRGLDAFFEPGSEILVAHSADDSVLYLDLPEHERRAVGERARRRVLREHTAAHRAASLEASLRDALAARRVS
jgi:spore maturation protein CgeB